MGLRVHPQREDEMAKQKINRDMVSTPAIWGTIYPPDPKLWQGKITLMEADGWGQRYFKNEDVAAKKKRGWRVVEFVDPTLPASSEHRVDNLTKRGPGRPPRAKD
jgi:hypothetical protein